MISFSIKRTDKRCQCFIPAVETATSSEKVPWSRSGTGPNGKFITVQETNGRIRSLTLSKLP